MDTNKLNQLKECLDYVTLNRREIVDCYQKKQQPSSKLQEYTQTLNDIFEDIGSSFEEKDYFDLPVLNIPDGFFDSLSQETKVLALFGIVSALQDMCESA